jgi:hypothetical protein
VLFWADGFSLVFVVGGIDGIELGLLGDLYFMVFGW